jgi:TetR/AcrR family transcriptional regulator, cholesterol catabolism regulator
VTVSELAMRRKNAAVETEILRVAAQIISERGYQATTLDDIAAAANISRRTFYSYFAGKDDLLRHIYREVITTQMTAAKRIAEQDVPALEKLRRLIRQQVSVLATHTPLLRVFFTEIVNLPGTLSRSVAQANRAYSQIFERVIADGVRTGELISLEPQRFSYLVLGLCNWMHRWYQPGGAWTPDVIAEEIIHVLEGGYLRREEEVSNQMLMQELRALRQEVKLLRVVPKG